jgi:hypothetical protein
MELVRLGVQGPVCTYAIGHWFRPPGQSLALRHLSRGKRVLTLRTVFHPKIILLRGAKRPYVHILENSKLILA